mmetsp:Transcript_29887/g.88454  ORF Transcript_29887/g.88454 Transcript_29887/m.88454 type:complete len:143 (+) Transcript_29887:3680-4108(+)
MTLLCAMARDASGDLMYNVCRVTSCCCCCGREISSTKSVEQGIGPVCVKRVGRFLAHQPVTEVFGRFADTVGDAVASAKGVLEMLRALDPESDTMISNVLEMLSGDVDHMIAMMVAQGISREGTTVDDFVHLGSTHRRYIID